MKKILLFGLVLGLASFAKAQNQRDSLSASLQGNNEIKLNILLTVLGSVELTYERIVGTKSAVGVSIFIRFTNSIKSDFSYGVTPYFRRYFGTRKASGFFLEGHGTVAEYDGGGRGVPVYDYGSGYYYPRFPIKKTVFGLGIATGAKFLTRKGFTGEIYLGAAKAFDDVADFFPRVGLTLGKRF